MHERVRRAARFGLSSCLLIAGTHCALARAAELAAAAAPASPSTIFSRVADGRELLDADDIKSVAALRAVAQDSLDTLSAATTASEASAGADFETRTSASTNLRKAREAAASAHLAWGEAADRFARRDEAITALARALDLANQAVGVGRQDGLGEMTDLQRDSRSALNAVLGSGLPMVAADDALEIIASQAHGKLWTPHRFTFPLPASIAAPALDDHLFHAANGMVSPLPPAELLVTSGKLFPPENPTVRQGESRLSRVPPLYRAVPPESLPASLKMDRLITGYIRETSGPNRGLWRQVVRVFYTSTYQTQDNRDDRPRAEALCLQLLRTAAMMRAGLGLTNTYTADGVTTLWLSEVSAWWPSDDDEPGVSDRLPPRMPLPNTPLRPQTPLPRDVETTPLMRPWRAAATLDSAPGDILFFKMKESRPEAEWLREAMHEYGHVVVPPFDRFAAPLEPYGNGMIGESLGMMWATAIPTSWGLSDDATPNFAPTDEVNADLNIHTAQYALPSLKQFQISGPLSDLRRDHTLNGLRYLTGLAVYLDRVYGAPLLGKALAPLVRRGNGSGPANPPALTAETLLGSSAAVLRDGVESSIRPLPVWLGGVFESKLTAAGLAARAPIAVTGALNGWIYVPAKANKLSIVWQGSTPAASLIPVGWKTWPAPREGVNGVHVLTVSTVNKTGWQQLSLAAKGSVIISGAAFEQWLE